MYADVMTDSMRRAIDETTRRREVQAAYNVEHGITPQGIAKTIRDINDRLRQVADQQETYTTASDLPKEEIARLVGELERQMKQAAKELDFERATLLRDQVVELKSELLTGDTPDSLRGYLEQTKRPDQRAQRGGRTRPGSRRR